MRYANIDNCEICNGEGVGISLFVQGCPIHCKDCFNQEAWDFNGGKEWTAETQEEFLNLADKPYITRISILGGEPLADQNISAVYDLIVAIKNRFEDEKKIWLYTGYYIDEIKYKIISDKACLANSLLLMCDYIVDGRYEHEERDLSLKFRGSKNQHIWHSDGVFLNKVE